MTDTCTYVVILNWRSAEDTVACLSSVFRSADVRLKVIVCDNDSGDGSLDAFESWGQGNQCLPKGESEMESP